jgi:transcriptional regulator with XRE-family HTH domain
MTMELLAGERRRSKVSQGRLAEALGMSRGRLATLETSTMVIPTDHFAEEWMSKLRQPVLAMSDD